MKQPNAAVIGSGFGGLSAAIRLQAAGISTTLFEKRDVPGGRAYVYRDKGFTFDAGPTVITAPECVSELFELKNKKMEDYVQMMPVDPFYRLIWDDGTQLDYCQDEEKLLEQIGKMSPRDVQGYKDFLEYSRQVFDAGYTDLVHVPFLKFWDMIRVSPELVRLQAYRSVYSMVSKYIRNDYLRQAFSFNSLLIGGNPFEASSIYTLIHYLEKKWGVFFPKGGTGALVSGLVKYFEDLGGTVVLNAEIDEITTHEGRVTGVKTKNGQQKTVDLVVSNAEGIHTYRDLLKKEPKAKKPAQRLEKMDYSMSLFLVYFGVKKQYPELAHHTVLFGPRYKGLITEIFEGGDTLAEDFSLYLHSPTRSDPSLAPEGCDSFYVLSPVPHLGKLKIDWTVEGPKYADRILSYLEKKCLPDLKQNIVTQRIFTPEDFKTQLNSHMGSAFSLQPTLMQSAYFRMHNRDADISGLYFVGAGTHPGAGVPGVINSGKATAGVILKDLEENRLRVGEPLSFQPL